MRTKPSIEYSGYTLILDAPSRFDNDNNRLLSGPAERWFNEISIYPVCSLDIRTYENSDPWLPNTKGIILAGSRAADKYTKASNDPPGYIKLVPPGIPGVPVFDIQDCCDFKNLTGSDEEHEENFTERDSKERIPTRRKNYRFWTEWGIKKLYNSIHAVEQEIKPICYPQLSEVTQVLHETRDQDFYLDIESSRTNHCLTVLGFSTSRVWPKIYVVPVYLYNGNLAYSSFHRLHLAFSRALTRNTVVGHNIAGFDLVVLSMFYGFPLPVSDPYDTMLANHRCFPEAEKSLAHVISQWTRQPYHKDFGTDVYNSEQQNKLWIYNARDVYNLKLIKDAQTSYAESIPGLASSIAQANSSIIPYIVTSLTGLRLDQVALAQTGRKLARQKEAMARIASILVGRPFNPGSSQQCAKFFHDELEYPVVSKTPDGKPAMGSKQLYQLMLKYSNPLLPVIIKYREAAKDLSTLESELI